MILRFSVWNKTDDKDFWYNLGVENPTFSPKVVLALIQKDGRFVLIKRRVPSMRVEWAFPGGVSEAGEALTRFTSDVHPLIRSFVMSFARE